MLPVLGFKTDKALIRVHGEVGNWSGTITNDGAML